MAQRILMRPPHLGQASASAAQTLRINRAQARLRRRRKSSGSGSGAEMATGVMPAAVAGGVVPGPCCCSNRNISQFVSSSSAELGICQMEKSEVSGCCSAYTVFT